MVSNMLLKRIAIVVLALALVLPVAGTALAARGERPDEPGSRRNDGAATTAGHGDDHEARKAARLAAMESFRAGIETIREDYKTALDAIRADWLAGKTAVIDECHAADPRVPHCIRDGLRALRDDARAEAREARGLAMDALHAARKAAFDALKPETETLADDEAAVETSTDTSEESTEESSEETTEEESTEEESTTEDDAEDDPGAGA